MNRTKTSQDTYGATGQMTFNQDWIGKKNQFVIGAGYDYTLLRFRQSERVNVGAMDEVFTYDRRPITSGSPFEAYDAGADEGGEGLLNQKQTTGLTGKQYTARLFATDTLSLNDKWHLNAGASWNFTRIDNTDTLRGPYTSTNLSSLTDKDSYTRLNPTVGLTHTPNDNLTLFTSYSESSRAPTSIELGCSNPAQPCLLPSAMADDPPLKQVVAKTYDFGVRGDLTESIKWNASLYQANNHNDIQFIRAPGSSSRS
jgi:outer membrane receptor protein involved in Fe transport